MKNNKPIDYRMTKKMFNAILSTQPEEDKSNPYEYVMGVLNEQYGLRGKVTHIAMYNT